MYLGEITGTQWLEIAWSSLMQFNGNVYITDTGGFKHPKRDWHHVRKSKAWFKNKECVPSHFSHAWLCNPKDCSPPGSSVHQLLQARILEWVAMPFSRGSSRIVRSYSVRLHFSPTLIESMSWTLPSKNPQSQSTAAGTLHNTRGRYLNSHSWICVLRFGLFFFLFFCF